MSGTLTTKGRTGQQICYAVLRGEAQLEELPLSFRHHLACTAIRRLLHDDPAGILLIKVVMQAICDIGSAADDSLPAWHRGEMDIWLDSLGANPECVREILQGLRLWDWVDVHSRRESARIEPTMSGNRGARAKPRLSSVRA